MEFLVPVGFSTSFRHCNYYLGLIFARLLTHTVFVFIPEPQAP